MPTEMTLRRSAVAMMSLRRLFAVVAASCLAIIFAQVSAVAHGSGGAHAGFGPASGHGFYGGHFHGSYGHGLHREFRDASHHDHFGHHFAMHDFGHENGHGLDGRFGHWQPGVWHAASGFGGRARWHEEGIWSR